MGQQRIAVFERHSTCMADSSGFHCHKNFIWAHGTDFHSSQLERRSVSMDHVRKSFERHRNRTMIYLDLIS